MKTYKKGVDLFLINGDIYLTDPSISNGFNTHSTKEHPGTKQLDRTKFIKPIDLMELYNKAKEEFGNSPVLGYQSFKAGYNTNKAEFTRYDMDIALAYASMSATLSDLDSIKRIFYSNYPKLSLPELIKINDNDEIVEVLW